MPLWARLRRGGENDGAGRRSHGREADGRPGSAQRNATEWEQGPERERKPRVGKEEGPRFRGADYEICRWRYFLNVKKVTKERRGFAVGAPARRSRDGDGKTAVRGGEAMAAKRTTAQGGFAQRNAAPAFARQTQKAGPMTGRAVSPQVKCDRTGARAGAGTEAACGKRGRPPAVAGTITSLRRPTFLALRK